MATTAVPVHILMLPSGGKARVSTQPPAEKRVDDDYLEKRHAYRLSRARDAIAGANSEASGKAGETQKSEVGAVRGGNIAAGDVCSPLEIDIASCCDGGRDGAGPGGPPVNSDGSRCSSFAEESGTSGSGATRISNSTGVNDDGKEEKESEIGGAISKGSEGRFVALVARHCHTAADRALALAVMQRTMERDEVVSKRAKKRKLGQVKEEQQNHSEKSSNSTNGATTTISDGTNDATPPVASDKEEKGNHSYNDCHRMANVLSAGGLKVLNQWLIEAFTPIQPVPTPLPAQSKQQHGSKRKRQSSSAEEVSSKEQSKPKASPTGPILLPLLMILQSIPFRLDLVMDSQINKQIRKLNKNLKLVRNDDESSSSSDDDFTHPFSGGMPVAQVQKDVQKLMDTWKDAAAGGKERSINTNGGDGSCAAAADPPVDFYADLRAKMTERFEVLSRYEAGEVPKPDWLEKLDPTPKPAVKAAAGTKLTPEEQKRRAEASKRMLQTQAELKAAQAARLEAKEKMEQYRKRMKEKRKAAELAAGRKQGETEQGQQQEQPPQKVAKKERTRKVTWVDQKIATAGAQARPLAEVREFVRETDVYQSEEEEKRGQDIEDESDEKLEEDDYDDCDYDEETQASGSIDSDDFDSIPYNEEDVNFSQEEEAGFAVETQEVSKDTNAKGVSNLDSSTKDNEAEAEDGWTTYTYNL